MRFKNIFFITIILLAILSVSAVSADDLADDVNIIEADSSIDSVNDVVIGANETTVDDTPQSSIQSNNLTKYYKNSTQYRATFYDNNGTPIVGQKIPIVINKANYTRTTNSNGTINFNINLEPGSYVLKVTNPVTNESVSNSIVVLPRLNASNVVKSYMNGTQYLVSVLDGQGNPSAGKKIGFNINGIFYNRTTNKDGIAKMNIKLNSGKYTITAENLENGEKVSNTVTVLSTIEGKDIKLYYNNGTQYIANFTNSQGNKLNNTKIQFNINGVMYNRTTNDNGTARLNIKLNPGKYTITAINPETKELKSNTVEVLNKIVVKNSNSGNNVSIEFNNNGKYTVELHHNNGSLAANETVTFNINGILYKRTSNVNGTASLNIKLQPGNYVVTADYGGCKVSNTLNVRVTPELRIINTTVKNNDYVKFRLTEKVSGNPITGNHYGIVHFNGTTYGAYPDATGLVQIRVNLPVGSHLFYFGTIDDGWYSSILNGNSINIVD